MKESHARNKESTARVLVIDDEPGICDIVCLNLEGAGYHAECAQSGQAAMEKLESVDPDIIILDIMMPEMDGWEVLSHIKAEPATSNIPVILLSAKSEEVSKLLGFQLGAQDYVTKPFSVKELIARVGAVLERFNEHETAAAGDARKGNRIEARKGSEVLFLEPSDVYYFSAERNNSHIHTNDEEYVQRHNLGFIEKQLPANFVRLHKSYIVNIDKIGKLYSPHRGAYLVELTNDDRTVIPVSRSKAAMLRRSLTGVSTV